MERELNEQEINLERENIVIGGMPTENYYTKTEVNELLETKADSNDIPTSTSELTNDSGFIVSETDPVFSNSVAHNITSNDITAWNNKSNFSGSYNDLTNKPTIPTVPTNLSSFTDDLGSSPTHTHSQYLTEHQSLANYYTKSEVDNAINSAITTTLGGSY